MAAYISYVYDAIDHMEHILMCCADDVGERVEVRGIRPISMQSFKFTVTKSTTSALQVNEATHLSV